jgi:hypothetical protein
MHKVKSNQFPIETRHHRMAGFPDVYQLKYGSKGMLYFGFENQEEYQQALELTEGERYIVKFPKQYNPAQFEKMTHPEPLVTPTDLNYPYIPRVGYELVTVKNAGTMLQGILDYCNPAFVKQSDYSLGMMFMESVKKWIYEDRERTYAIYCDKHQGKWDLIHTNECEDGAGLYLAILVKGGSDV